MAYLASNKIDVFPSTNRANYEQKARLITESNLINLINQLLDRESFLITNKENYSASEENPLPLEFNIHGYYFKVAQASDIIKLFSSPAANQIIEAAITTTTANEYTLLEGSDSGSGINSQYQGVVFSKVPEPTSDTISDTTAVYHLPLLIYNGSAWELYTANYKLIDGGEY